MEAQNNNNSKAEVSDAAGRDDFVSPSSSNNSISVGSSSSGGSGGSGIVFTSPFEDTFGLDVFAQIAASAHPLPVESASPRRATISSTSSIVQQSQSQLAQSIYQNQQAIRIQQQQKRDSVDSTVNKFNPKITDDDDDDDEDDDDSDDDGDSLRRKTSISSVSSFGSIGGSGGSFRNYSFVGAKASSSFLETPIKEETETDLQMDVDQSINFQRRRSPSLMGQSHLTNLEDGSSVSSPSGILSSTYSQNRRLSAPENVSNFTNYASSFSTRRVIHNICERKRRENIREGFEQLQNRLPEHLSSNPKLSKMEILVADKNLITEIRGRISNLSAEISALSQVSEEMRNKSEDSSSKAAAE